MKLISIEINNLGMHEDSVIPINKPLVAFYGDIKQGKTTILNAIKLGFGGGFPADIIRRGEAEGSVFLTFEDNTTISRSFYRNKQGETVSRPISFVQNGRVVKNPVKQLQQLINPFLVDNEFFMKMSALDRQKYLLNLFGVDTSQEDTFIKNLEGNCKSQRAQIKSYGEIDVTPVEKPDVEGLHKKRDEMQQSANKIFQDHEAAVREYNNELLTIKHQTEKYDNLVARRREIISEINTLQAELEAVKKEADSISISKAPTKPEPPVLPDTSEIDEKISNAKADEVKYELYQQALGKKEKKDQEIKTLRETEAFLKQKRQEKLDKLIELSENTGIQGLEFKEGGFMYKDVDDGMLSTSDLLELSNQLAGLYKDGLKLELVDRGESLGKSIQDLADHAEADERTVLVTVVGDAPAEVPGNIGVFVVEAGKVEGV